MTSKRKVQLLDILHDAEIYFTMGLFVEAKEKYLTAIKIDDQYHEAYLGVGKCLINLGYLVEARPYLETAAKNKKSNRDALFNLSLIYIELERYNDAINLLNILIAKDPDFSLALNNRAYVLKLQNRFDEALRDSQRARNRHCHFGLA